jgi:uncharacterized protein YunC (DUF1805 family)
LYAEGGAALSMPGLSAYQAPTICEAITWQASGAGSVLSLPGLTHMTGNTNCAYLNIQALSGGQVLLNQVVTNLGGYASVQADGNGSLVNLSGLAANLGTINLEASAGGGVSMTSLTTSGALNLTVNAGGSISTAQLTNISGASFIANAGAELSFPAVVSYEPPTACAGITWQANGGGSVLDLSALSAVTGNTNCGYLTVQALNGGHMLLGNVASDLGGSMSVQADGTDSEVDMSLLTQNLGTLNLESSGGGSVLTPKLANGGVINLTLGAGGSLSTAQFTNLTGANISVSGGTTLSFPGVVSYEPPTNCEGIAWTANGAGSVLSMPALTNLAGNTVCGYLNVEALNGGQVLLSHVTAIHDGYQTFMANGMGSEIDLSQMSGMVLVNGQGSLTAQDGGTILFNNEAFLLSNVAISIGAGNPVLPPTLISSQALTLYGIPWHAYKVQERNTLDPDSTWTTILVPATNNFQAIAAAASANTAFIVEDFVANPPILQLGLTGDEAQLVLFGETNATYQIQSTTNLATPIPWTSNATAIMTNAFRFFPESQAKAPVEFLRAEQK